MPIVMNKTTAAAPSWLKSGAQSNKALQEATYNQQKAMEDAKRMRRFWLKAGEEATVTFLDGMLDKDGLLNFFSYNEHTVQVANGWDNFVCVSGDEICPLCNAGDKPSLVGVFTVINHTPYTVKNGPNAGKVVKDQRQLYVAKMTTLKQLQHFATKKSGLNGWKVEISRMGDKDPRVGSSFQFLERQTPQDIAKAYGAENAEVADLAKEIRFMSAAEMTAAGLGKPVTGPGFGGKAISDQEIDDQM